MLLQFDRKPVLLADLGISNTKLYDDIKLGLFVTPVKIGGRISVWPRHEVEAIKAAIVAGKSSADIRQLVTELMEQRTSDRVAA